MVWQFSFYSCTENQSLFGGNKINPAEMYIYHTYLSTRNLPYNAYDVSRSKSLQTRLRVKEISKAKTNSHL